MQKIALITGANKGIGFETARQLGAQNITVLIGARDKSRGEAAAQTLQNEGIDALFLLIDPTDAASVEAAAREVEAKFGHLDILINNAGAVVEGDMLAPPSSVFTSVLRDTYELNVFGVHEVTRAFWPLLEKSDAARLVNVSSMLGSLSMNADFDGPMKNFQTVAYASSKAALNMLTLNYASQWHTAPHRANTVHPGNVKTGANPGGEISVEAGAKTGVELALIPNDGPNGTFSYLGETLPW